MQLDQRFRVVPPFQGLKRWKHYSLVSQWTGAEYRSLCRQLVPVLAPILSKVSVGAMHCTRAIMDFVMLARYASHTEETLRYMEHTLFRIDKTKGALREHRPTKAFNFLKWHAMSHYTYLIRRYGAAIGFDTAISETEHIEQVKNFYARTNKKDFEVQILRHNTRDLKMRVLRDLHLYRNGYIASTANHDAKPQVNRVAQAINHGPKGINWPKSQAEKQEIIRNRKKTNHWCYASTLAREAKLSDLLDALAVFVRGRRKKGTNEELDPIRREADPSWVAKYLVQIHPSITTWKKTGKNPRDPNELTEEKLYCCPNWQRRGQGWRNDNVWVQEYAVGDKNRHNKLHPQDGRLVGQLLVTLTVVDKGCRDDRGVHPKYTGSMVATRRYRNAGKFHDIHGMIEVEEWLQSTVRTPRILTGRRFYKLTNIIRSAHLIPGRCNGKDIFYVNNYIDFDQFNTLYDLEFEKNGTRAVLEVAGRYI